MNKNPAVLVANPEPRRVKLQPFEHDEIEQLEVEIGPRYGPLVVFAAHTGLRPGEWIALERRDVDRTAQVVRVERSISDNTINPYGKTDGSRRSVPLPDRALAALDATPARIDTPLLFPAPGGGYINLDNWRNREWYPGLEAAGLAKRGPYALRDTYASHGLAANVTLFELARVMGTSTKMIERTYGHLARDSLDNIRARLDTYANRLGVYQASGKPSH